MLHHNDHFIFKTMRLLWVENFWCPTAGSVNPDTFMAFHRWELCLTIICGLFTRGRIYPFLLIPGTYFLYHFNQSCHFVELVPFTEPTQSNTKRSVDLHSHPFNAMSQCICNAMCHCMLSHVTCINTTWNNL